MTEARQPIFNAPFLAMLIPLVIVGGYALQCTLSPRDGDNLIEAYALIPVLLRQGDVLPLITHQFLHGSWMHALFNAGFCLAFATPVVRALGKGAGGVLSYLGYFLVCGVVAGIGYCLLNSGSMVPVLGASGAISGLLGAAIRLQGAPGRLVPLAHPRVIAMSLTWCGINLASAFVPTLMGAEQGQGIAWQTHIVGYIFGLLSIWLWLKCFHRHYFTTS